MFLSHNEHGNTHKTRNSFMFHTRFMLLLCLVLSVVLIIFVLCIVEYYPTSQCWSAPTRSTQPKRCFFTTNFPVSLCTNTNEICDAFISMNAELNNAIHVDDIDILSPSRSAELGARTRRQHLPTRRHAKGSWKSGNSARSAVKQGKVLILLEYYLHGVH